MLARTNTLPEKRNAHFFVFFENDLSFSNLCHFRTADATAARLDANESSFDVDSETPIVDLAITSESPFITVKRCTKTFGLGSRMIRRKKRGRIVVSFICDSCGDLMTDEVVGEGVGAFEELRRSRFNLLWKEQQFVLTAVTCNHHNKG